MLHLNLTRFTAARIRRRYCPTCENRTRFACLFQDWYGWLITCLSCGDRWQDGELMPRPFAPGWRKNSVEKAKRAMERFKEDNPCAE